MDKVSTSEAVTRLIDSDKSNVEKIAILEKQVDDLVKSFEAHRDGNAQLIKDEVQKMGTTLSETLTNTLSETLTNALTGTFNEQVESVRSLTNTYHEEVHQSQREMKIALEKDIERVFNKLDELVGRVDHLTRPYSNPQPKNEQNSAEISQPNYLPRSHAFQMTPILRRAPEMPVNMNESQPRCSTSLAHELPLTGFKQSIIVPPASAAPIFHGKNDESPTQFLIRVEEYATSVLTWDRNAITKGISQFLQDSALEWYCQLCSTHRRPESWLEFKEAFLAQFNSPLRKARQEQEWYKCTQKENEPINEFVVRLRALWREQKPKENEADFVKHLFCRMRNDLLNMIGVSRNASLDEVLTEVQQIEDILYRRAKGERLAKQIKQSSTSNVEASYSKPYKDYRAPDIIQRSNKDDSYNNYSARRNVQVNEITPSYRQSYKQNHPRTTSNTNQQMESLQCYTCGNYGHWSQNCPTSYTTYQQGRNKPISKNMKGALDERAS